jgi:hypothetical protein
VSEAAAAMVMDKKRSVRMPVSFSTPWTFAIGLILA